MKEPTKGEAAAMAYVDAAVEKRRAEVTQRRMMQLEALPDMVMVMSGEDVLRFLRDGVMP